MIPAGPERDLAILKTKGYIEVPAPDFWSCDSKIGLQRENDLICPVCMLTPWSTDITAAMILWAEMREAKQWPSLNVMGTGDVVLCYLAVTDDEDMIEYQAETEADAISGCYLKWKESQ
jgi:hypothetical protein